MFHLLMKYGFLPNFKFVGRHSMKIEDFTKGIMDYPIHSFGLIDNPKVLANIVECFVGAVFFNCKLSTDTENWIYPATKVVKKLLEPMITTDSVKMHPVTKLQELCQKKGWNLNFDKSGWKNNGQVEVYIEDELVGIGEYIPKICIAKNRAAHDAFDKICSQNLTFLKKTNVTSKYHHDHHRNNDDHDDEEDNKSDDNRISIIEKKNEDHDENMNNRKDKRDDSPPINKEDHHIHYDDQKNKDHDDKSDDHPLLNKEDHHVHDDKKNYSRDDDDNQISTDEKRDHFHHHHDDEKKNHNNDYDNRILTDEKKDNNHHDDNEKNEDRDNKKDNPPLIDKKDHHVHHDDEKNQERNYNLISVDKKK